jgi:hypothetical protein
MLDAMVQLLTGSKEGFDPLFFGELVECMNSYDIDLVNVQVLNGKWREILKGRRALKIIFPIVSLSSDSSLEELSIHEQCIVTHAIYCISSLYYCTAAL